MYIPCVYVAVCLLVCVISCRLSSCRPLQKVADQAAMDLPWHNHSLAPLSSQQRVKMVLSSLTWVFVTSIIIAFACAFGIGAVRVRWHAAAVDVLPLMITAVTRCCSGSVPPLITECHDAPSPIKFGGETFSLMVTHRTTWPTTLGAQLAPKRCGCTKSSSSQECVSSWEPFSLEQRWSTRCVPATM